LVVDDHRTFADLLALALSEQPDLRCAGTAHSVHEGLALAHSLRPDIVVMDVRLGDGDGIEATAELTAWRPEMRVIVLTAHASQALMERSAAAGACCLLPKDGSLDDMLAALRGARRDGFVVHPSLLKSLMSGPRDPHPRAPQLTTREQEILEMLAKGLDARTVSRQLGISLSTCRGYVHNLLVKLGAHSQLEAVVIARRRGLIRDLDE
jgi:DNA-binding NarL/FixJ family response regulator